MNVKEELLTLKIEDIDEFKSISIEKYKQKPTMIIEYDEKIPLLKNSHSEISCIKYEKIDNSTSKISYQKKLTKKSGLDMVIYIENNNIITEGFIDFYTIKKSTTKRNSFYRLEFKNKLFKLYATTSRKRNFRQSIASYQINENINPENLSIVTSRMINNIQHYIKSHNKQNIIENLSSCLAINKIIELKGKAMDILTNLLDNPSLAKQEQMIIKNYLSEHNQTKENKQILTRKK